MKLFGALMVGTMLFCGLAVAQPCGAVTGWIAATVQNKINIATGDKIVVSLGQKAGVIKGDMLRIVTAVDQGISNPLGACPVIEARENSSICQIMKARTEIDRGCLVVAKDLVPGDGRMYPHLFRMMSETVDGYAPHEPVRVHIHAIYDSANNVTVLSQRIVNEILSLYAQKERITVKGVYKEGDLKLYPEKLRDNYQTVKYFMEKADIDVIVTGAYRMEGDEALVTLYSVDRRHGDRSTRFALKLDGPGELAEAGGIITPYNPQEIDEYVPCRIEYAEKPYVPHRDERRHIIAFEAGDNTFKANEMRRTAFNIISPVEIAVRFDKEKVPFGLKNDSLLLVQKGLHRVSASYKRGYFFNTKESLVYTSDSEVTREALLDLSSGGPVVVRVTLNPALGKDGVEIDVFRERDQEKTVLKPISTVEAGRVIEYFKD